MKEVLCASCGSWVQAETDVCSICGQLLYPRERKELEEREADKRDFSFPLTPIPENASPPVRLLYWFIRVPQLIFYALVFFISYIVAGFSG